MNNCENIFKRIDSLEKEYLEFLEEFCLIESPTDFKEGVDAAGNYVVEKAKALGWKIERQEQKVSGDCICITMNPDAKEAPVCLSGHIDTVHPLGLFGTPAVKVTDDKIYGPGIADCKGGIVAAFMAMAALEKEGFRSRPIKLILQSDEETSSAGSEKSTVRYMCKCAEGAVAFLNCEPSVEGTVVLQRKGILKYSFNITGKAAHASRCFIGVSAIAEAAHKILELEKYKDKNGITANCGIISGGTKINTVPEKCVLQVELRFSNSDELALAQNIAKSVAERSWVEGTKCELVLKSHRDAMELTEKNLCLLEKVNDIFDSVGLPRLSYRAEGGGSDAAYTTQCGIPTLDSMGVISGNIHTTDEHTPVSSLKESAKRIAAICCCI